MLQVGDRQIPATYNRSTRVWTDTTTGKPIDFEGKPVSQIGKITAEDAALGINHPPTPEQRQSYAGQAATGMPLPQIISGYGKAALAARKQAHDDAIDLIKKQNPGMTDEDAGTELANRSINFHAETKSLGQLTTSRNAVETAVKQLDFNIDKTKEEMDNLGSTNILPVLNAIARGEEKWTGEPAYSSLFYYMQATATESALILSNGTASQAQLREGAREEAKKWADENMTPASFDRVARAMKAEGRNRLENYDAVIKSNKFGSPAAGAPGAVKPGKYRYDPATGNMVPQ